MRRIQILFPAAVMAFGFLLVSTSMQVQGKPEFSKTEKTSCVTCHVKVKEKELNKVGDCYKKSKDLKACKAEQ